MKDVRPGSGLAAFMATLLGLLFASTSTAYADITIKLSLEVESERITPKPRHTLNTQLLTIVLSGSKQVKETYFSSGAHPNGGEQIGAFNQTSGAGSARYRVVNEHTIERIQNAGSHVTVITIFVEGKSCRIDYRATLKPGHEAFEGVSTELGVKATYKYFRLASSTCEISN